MVLEDRHRAGVRLPVGLRGRVADLRGFPASASVLASCRLALRTPSRTPCRRSRRRRRADHDDHRRRDHHDRAERDDPPPQRPGARRSAAARARSSGRFSGSPSSSCQSLAIRSRDHRRRASDDGRRAMTTDASDLAEALAAAYPELEAVGGRGAGPGLPGRRRGPRPAAGARAGRPRPRGRGRSGRSGGGARGRAGRRAPTVRDAEGASWAGEEVDIAATRRETYAVPGALPTVEVGAPIRTDLARRDFTVNAMAVPLAEPRELIDPYDGREDLERGVLRVIHDGLVRRRPDPGDPRGPLRGAVRVRAGAADRGDAAGRPTWGR